MGEGSVPMPGVLTCLSGIQRFMCYTLYQEAFTSVLEGAVRCVDELVRCPMQCPCPSSYLKSFLPLWLINFVETRSMQAQLNLMHALTVRGQSLSIAGSSSGSSLLPRL